MCMRHPGNANNQAVPQLLSAFCHPPPTHPPTQHATAAAAARQDYKGQTQAAAPVHNTSPPAHPPTHPATAAAAARQDYKGQTQAATLTEEGKITAMVAGKELTFESPSSFSIYIKRLVNPTRKADDGWKTVRYGGK